jgi:hypothetical protein
LSDARDFNLRGNFQTCRGDHSREVLLYRPMFESDGLRMRRVPTFFFSSGIDLSVVVRPVAEQSWRPHRVWLAFGHIWCDKESSASRRNSSTTWASKRAEIGRLSPVGGRHANLAMPRRRDLPERRSEPTSGWPTTRDLACAPVKRPRRVCFKGRPLSYLDLRPIRGVS